MDRYVINWQVSKVLWNIIYLFVLNICRMGFPCGSSYKESACNEGDLGLIPGLGRSPGGDLEYPEFWPGEFQGLCSPWVSKESDTERLSLLISGNSLWNKVLLRRIFQGLLEWSHT